MYIKLTYTGGVQSKGKKSRYAETINKKVLMPHTKTYQDTMRVLVPGCPTYPIHIQETSLRNYIGYMPNKDISWQF